MITRESIKSLRKVMKFNGAFNLGELESRVKYEWLILFSYHSLNELGGEKSTCNLLNTVYLHIIKKSILLGNVEGLSI
jgi:hypothetical protein